jgi:putative flippase GtrA
MHFVSESVTVAVRSDRLKSVARWWVVGLLFTAWSTGVLYVVISRWRWSVPVGTFTTAEVGTVLRFLVNDRWVFGHPRPTLRRFWQYHLANAGGFVIWWSVCNVLPLYGIHYLIASLLATGCSVALSMLTNFLWIWRRKRSADA